jgi:hypothetical protein
MTKTSYGKYLLVYVDDLLAIGVDPRTTINTLETDCNYVLKKFGPPTRYVGSSICTYNLYDTTTCFFMAPDQYYLVNVIAVVQRNIQKDGIKFNSIIYDVAMTPVYHPEVDTSDPLDADAANLYQSYVGILRFLPCMSTYWTHGSSLTSIFIFEQA